MFHRSIVAWTTQLEWAVCLGSPMGSNLQQFDVVVLGAGAAGLMCAIEAGKRGRRVTVLDHADRAGKKILISGGGRCNFTNLHTSSENFLTENPHFVHSALNGFTPADMVAMVERHGIAYHEKTLGQLFCDHTARDILTMLERECSEVKVQIKLGINVRDVSEHRAGFVVETDGGTIVGRSVVVATGGLSIPQMGATGLGYELARKFGVRVIEPRPGLVPVILHAEDRGRWCDLSGVSAEAEVTVRGPVAARPRRRGGLPVFREKVLITHRGLSGPAILQASSFWHPGYTLSLDLAPGMSLFATAGAPGSRDPQTLAAPLRARLPARWAERWLDLNFCGVEGGRLLSNAAISALEEKIHDWEIVPAGTEGFAKAEVTVGGVDTAELDAKTMQVRRAPGLFFIGEVVDVTGWLGGYNFQWAWASGVAAGSFC